MHAQFAGAMALAVLLLGSPSAGAYDLVWQDEFDGTQLDPGKWEPQIGTGCPSLCGWGNNELQYYRAENATVGGGFLTITAKEEAFGGRQYTSARLRTKDLGDWQYGRFEMRARMPIGQGLWAAFWMLPTDEIYGGWAASGEIDIMEYLGHRPGDLLGTLHYGGSHPDNLYSGGTFTRGSGTFHDDFHVLALEWDPYEIRWFVDGVLYNAQTSWSSGGGPYPAPFDQAFHLLLNLAVGGNLPGPPDGTTDFPQELVVDWVRVYQGDPPEQCLSQFDGMDHGNPFANGWFQFGGSVGGGGIGPDFSDLPPINGGFASLTSGWGSGGTPGYFGGFGRVNPMDLSDATHFTLWINPDADQDYRLEINLQDDDNGDNAIVPSPNGVDDEFQFNLLISPTGPHAISGGGWQRISIPLADFFDDNSYLFGGNGILDPIPLHAGGNGQLIAAVATIVSNTGAPVNFRTDRWAFTRQVGSIAGGVWEDLDADGIQDAGEPGLAGAGVELIDVALGATLSNTVTAADGSYGFGELAMAEYEVRVDPATLPAGLMPTFDPDGIGTPDVFALDLSCEEIASGRSFGYGSPATDVSALPERGAFLSQNVPNPFAPRTVISFELVRGGPVELVVYDVTGRRIRELVRDRRPAGPHRASWDGRDTEGRRVGAGVYYYTLRTADGERTRSMALLR